MGEDLHEVTRCCFQKGGECLCVFFLDVTLTFKHMKPDMGNKFAHSLANSCSFEVLDCALRASPGCWGGMTQPDILAWSLLAQKNLLPKPLSLLGGTKTGVELNPDSDRDGFLNSIRGLGMH